MELESSATCDVHMERSYLVRFMSSQGGPCLQSVKIDFSKDLITWVKNSGYSLVDVNLYPKPSDLPLPVMLWVHFRMAVSYQANTQRKLHLEDVSKEVLVYLWDNYIQYVYYSFITASTDFSRGYLVLRKLSYLAMDPVVDHWWTWWITEVEMSGPAKCITNKSCYSYLNHEKRQGIHPGTRTTKNANIPQGPWSRGVVFQGKYSDCTFVKLISRPH